MTIRNVARTSVLAAVAALMAITGCKKSGGEGGAPAAKTYHFAFVTNNSAGFWNIAKKGVEKAEQDLGIKAEVMMPNAVGTDFADLLPDIQEH